MLEGADYLDRAGEIVKQSHERPDGEGYPEGLSGEEILLEAKVVAVVDAWDAMTSDRPYREGLDEEVAIQELKDNAVSQFEPEKSRRYDKPLAFLMADVNRFKEINDSYTHQTGDRVLKEVADLLRENVRDVETVLRYGGDEFLVMMTHAEGGE